MRYRNICRSVEIAALLCVLGTPAAAQQGDTLATRTRAPAWAVRGAIAGAVLGGGLGVLASLYCIGEDCSDHNVAAGAAIGVVAGAAVGALTGWITGSFVADNPQDAALADAHWQAVAGASALLREPLGMSVSAAVSRQTSPKTRALLEAGYGRFARWESSARYDDVTSTSAAERQFGYVTLVARHDIGGSLYGQARLGYYHGEVQHEQTQRTDAGAPPPGWVDERRTHSGPGVGGGLGLGVRRGRFAVGLEVLSVSGAELDLGALWALQGSFALGR